MGLLEKYINQIKREKVKMKSIHYGNSTDEHKELINKRIREEVLVNQSALVGRLFELDMENMTEGLENIEHIECDCCLSIYDDDDLTWSKCPKESGIKGQSAIDILRAAFTDKYTQLEVPGPFFQGSLC